MVKKMGKTRVKRAPVREETEAEREAYLSYQRQREAEGNAMQNGLGYPPYEEEEERSYAPYIYDEYGNECDWDGDYIEHTSGRE